MPRLLTTRSAKMDKSNASGLGYLERMLYLAPAKVSGFNVCKDSTIGCETDCFFTAGHGRFDNVRKARIRKTLEFFNDKVKFRGDLEADIRNFEKRCNKLGQKTAIRLNGLSDLPWEIIYPTLFTDFPNVQFYDYTKTTERMFKEIPQNYHLTYSRSEHNWENCLKVMEAGMNVAAVFNFPELTYNKMKAQWADIMPTEFEGIEVITNGEEHDFRFMDTPGLCALMAKGRARKGTSGFVTHLSL